MTTHAEHMRLMVGGARVELTGDPVHEIGRMSARIHELQDALASSRAELEGLIAAGQVNSERGRELLRLGHANQQDLGRVTARRHAAMVDARAEASPFPDAGPPVDNASAAALEKRTSSPLRADRLFRIRGCCFPPRRKRRGGHNPPLGSRATSCRNDAA